MEKMHFAPKIRARLSGRSLSLCCCVLVACALLGSYAQAAEVLSPISATFQAPPIRWYRFQQESISGQLVPFNWDSPERIRGHVALSRAAQNVSDHIRLIQEYGAVGLILYDSLSDYAGTYDMEDRGNLTNLLIPVWQIGVRDRDLLQGLLLDNNTNIFVSLSGNGSLEENQWASVRSHGYWYFEQVLFSFIFTTCASMALLKLLAHIRFDGRVQFSVAQGALFLEYLQNMIRLIFWVLDPIWLMRGALSWGATNVLLTIHHPIFIASTLLLALYWHQLLKFDKVKISVGLTRMRIPFAITALVLIAIELATIILRGVGSNVGTLTTVSGALIAVVALFTSVYFFVIGAKVLGQLSGTPVSSPSSSTHSSSTSKNKRDHLSIEHRRLIKRTTALIVSSGCLHILFVIIVFLTTFRSVFWHPYGFYIILSLKDFFLAGVSLCQIITFRMPTVGSVYRPSASTSWETRSTGSQPNQARSDTSQT